MDEELGGAQLPVTRGAGRLRVVPRGQRRHHRLPDADHRQRQPAGPFGTAEQVDALRAADAGGPLLRHDGAVGDRRPGSSLADITTRAEPQDDGTYRLFGHKMWISGGDHELAENIVHLVLAKIPGGPPGTKGISLFIVPKFLVDADGSIGERNDVALAGLNHKMGQRGTTNTVLNFGDGTFTPGGEPGAVGYLVGEPHRGLAYMFHMMNEARLGVGMGAVALGYTGYLKSLEYARERPQGRPLDGQGPVGAAGADHRARRRASECCWRRRPTSRAGWRWCCTAPRLVDVQHSAESDDERDAGRRCCSTC